MLLDGATGTELDRRGVDVTLPLWSARAIVEAPQHLEAIHREYLEAGADAITTNTFRTHRRCLDKSGWGDRAQELTQRAVAIARKARDEVAPSAIVLGSVAPLEDCYRPDLAPDEQACHAEHREIIENLADAGVDFILIETMNCLREARAAAIEANRIAPDRWMISFCLSSDGEPGELLSGENVTELIDELGGAHAIGVNCTGASSMRNHVAMLAAHLPSTTRILAYANVGYADAEGNWVITDAIDPVRYARYALEWIEAGATMVGGCCGTSPATIRIVSDRLENQEVERRGASRTGGEK